MIQDMQSYACVMNEIGFKDAMDRFCEVVLTPLAELLFPRQARNFGVDHRSYVVKYSAHEDLYQLREGYKRVIRG